MNLLLLLSCVSTRKYLYCAAQALRLRNNSVLSLIAAVRTNMLAYAALRSYRRRAAAAVAINFGVRACEYVAFVPLLFSIYIWFKFKIYFYFLASIWFLHSFNCVRHDPVGTRRKQKQPCFYFIFCKQNRIYRARTLVVLLWSHIFTKSKFMNEVFIHRAECDGTNVVKKGEYSEIWKLLFFLAN